MPCRPSRPARLAAPLLLVGALLAAACGTDPSPETWTWVAIPGSACGNGSATGLGVNLTGRSRDVVVYFQGGGACWNQDTCFYAAAHVTSGYGPTDFAGETTLTEAPFDRTNAANPFKDASFVFIPYCTGDLHAGDATNDYGGLVVHHAGALNTGAFLKRLAVTFPGARSIYVTGSSAGGYGVQLNYSRFAEAFPMAEVHALADSAQAVPPINPSYATLVAAWNLQLPAGCLECRTTITALPAWLATTYPGSRFALTAYIQDQTLSSFLGYTTGAEMNAATQLLLTDAFAPTSNARWFAIDGTSHTMLGGLASIASSPASGSVRLEDWVTAWYTGDPAWASVGP